MKRILCYFYLRPRFCPIAAWPTPAPSSCYLICHYKQHSAPWPLFVATIF
ncbi:MAG: hypothetical protein ORN57_05175 [Alphaproteobacteria bacterium]|nr:hypothetical protein [Alphaproteobacteria bacterium]